MAEPYKPRTSKFFMQNMQSFLGEDEGDVCLVSTLKRSSSSKKIKSGQMGEALALQLLKDKGYDILGQNVILEKVEIDIVARINDEVVFVEVRAREKNENISPEETITQKKMTAMLKAAKLWRAKYNYKGYYRIDLVAVTLCDGVATNIEHYESITEPIR